MVFATLGDFINRANQQIHRTSRRDNDNLLEFGILNNRFYLWVRNVDTEHDFRMGLVDIILDFVFTRQRMNHIGDSADFIDGIEHIDSLGSIRHADGNLLALFGANGFQSGSDSVDFFD